MLETRIGNFKVYETCLMVAADLQFLCSHDSQRTYPVAFAEISLPRNLRPCVSLFLFGVIL
jgi:hypothetical protein